MKLNTKLIEILKSFSVEDWNSFEEFILKNDAVSRRKYFALLDEFKKHLKNSKGSASAAAEELIAGAYGKADYSPQSVYNRQSELLKLCKSFLVERSLNSHEFMKDLFLSSEMLGRKLLKNYSGFRTVKEKLTEANLYKIDSYKYISDLFLDEAGYFQLIKQGHESIKSYIKFSDILFADTLNSIIKTQTELLMMQRTYNIKFDDMHFANMLNYLEDSGFFGEIEYSGKKKLLFPLIRFYVYKSLFSEDFRQYALSAEKIFFRNEALFSENFRLEIYRKLISAYLNRINSGEKKYFRDIYRLVRRKLAQNLTDDIKRDNVYNPFRDYIICGIALEKFKWVEWVIKKYSPILPEKTRYYETLSALIRLHIARKDYRKVLELTRNIKTHDIIKYTDISVYRLIALYEERKYEDCYKEIIAAKKHTSKKEDYMGMVSTFRMFLKAFRIILVNTNNPNVDTNKMKYLIGKIPARYMKIDWINEKAELLSKIK